jgi:hypothetical protein
MFVSNPIKVIINYLMQRLAGRKLKKRIPKKTINW